MAVARAIDTTHGGLRGAPKFPQCALFELLWRAGERAPREQGETRTAAPAFFSRVLLTLEHICEGGIYDHLGGGFSRYSVDERWLVPHFEKMLYDNAQLLELLGVAHAMTGVPLFRERAAETVGWLAREMTTPRGRVLGLARCGFGRRGGEVLRLVAGRDRAGARGGGCGVFCSAI